MKFDVITIDGAKSGSVELSDAVFAATVRPDLMQRVVLWQQARKRAGTADTKERGEIRASGKKIYRQKGTGGARHGDKKVNIFRGGGVVFGPTPRDFGFSLTKKVRALALKSALSAKMAGKQLVIIDEAKLPNHKTKELAARLTKLELTNALFIVDSLDDNFDRASRNIPHIRVLPTEGANVFNILKADKLVLTKTAAEMLSARIDQRASGANKEAS